MAGTRSSARVTANADSSPKSQQEKAQTGTKRRAESNGSSQSKRGRNATTKRSQKTLEETMPIAENSAVPGDIETKEYTAEGRAPEKEAHTAEDIPTEPQGPQERHKDETIKRLEEVRNLEVLRRLRETRTNYHMS